MCTLYNNKKQHICNMCNTKYISRQSLWNHNNRFHNDNSIQNVYTMSTPSVQNVYTMSTSGIHSDNIKNNICNYCNIKLSNRQSRWRHEQKCIKKNDKIDKLTKENTLLKKENEDIKNQISNILKQNKINKQLINGNINNTIINNTYIKFGNIGFEKLLTNDQILSILNNQCLSLEEAIKFIHFNDDLPEYNNIYITNMKDDLAYIFDGNKFISVKKNDIIADMIENYAYEIELSFDNNKNKLRDTVSKRIERFLKLINNDDKYTDVHNKTYDNFKAYKISDIKRLIYNYSNQKKLSKLNKL